MFLKKMFSGKSTKKYEEYLKFILSRKYNNIFLDKYEWNEWLNDATVCCN